MTAEIKDIKNPVVVSIGKPLSIIANIGLIGPKGDSGDLFNASINDLGDVQLTSPQNNDILIYNNSKFINQPATTLTDGGNF